MSGLRYGYFPLVLISAIGLFALAYTRGWNLEMAVLAITVGTLITTLIVERLLPFDADWNRPNGDVATDTTSIAVLAFVMDPLLKILGSVVVIALFQQSGAEAAFALFPSAIPFGAQVVLALLVLELGYYWAHRWHHSGRWLWRLHAFHHSSTRLYVINSARFHPLNYFNNWLLSTLPMLLIGTPGEVMLATLAIAQPVLFLQHANIDLRHGWLNRIFATNEVHRWHHSNLPAEGNSNYGRALVIWDQLFKSYRLPAAPSRPQALGLYSLSGYPAKGSYVAQVGAAFTAAKESN